MGLDMYLSGKRHVSDYRDTDKNLSDKVKHLGVPETLGRVEYIQTDAAYWRKANAIHQWFVDNIQDGSDNCGEYWVGIDQLKDLVGVCKQVLENNDLAKTLLPSQPGFFFGSTDYDEWYYQDLRLTVEQLEKILSTPEEELKLWEFFYSSSW